jgi:hypothetical protein
MNSRVLPPSNFLGRWKLTSGGGTFGVAHRTPRVTWILGLLRIGVVIIITNDLSVWGPNPSILAVQNLLYGMRSTGYTASVLIMALLGTKGACLTSPPSTRHYYYSLGSIGDHDVWKPRQQQRTRITSFLPMDWPRFGAYIFYKTLLVPILLVKRNV